MTKKKKTAAPKLPLMGFHSHKACLRFLRDFGNHVIGHETPKHPTMLLLARSEERVTRRPQGRKH